MTTAAAKAMLQLGKSETLEAIARRDNIPEPTEMAISPEEAAMILGDDPVDGDVLFHVRQRIKMVAYHRIVGATSKPESCLRIG